MTVTRRSKIWLIVASLFTLINILGAGYAATNREVLHTAVHVGLGVLGVYFVWRIARRSGLPQLPGADEFDQRLDRLQQSVDAVALEVERIGEAQRFTAKLAAERGERSQAHAAPTTRRSNKES
jgi:hypothetical protein